MKYLFMLIFCLISISTFAQKSEEAAIKKLIDDETYFSSKGEKEKWSSCWVQSDKTDFIYTNASGVYKMNGYDAIATLVDGFKPFDLKLKRDNYKFDIDKNIAFVSFDQEDNWGGENRKKHETRTLRKINGMWKISHATVAELSSFIQPATTSYHMPVNQMSRNPKNGFQNIYGQGGMSIGYMEVPGPADFSPFFKGLPDEMCSSPHWGYILEGSIKVKYPGGKEETVNAGELFYWPAPHTGVVEKSVKFIDFSPDGKFIPVIEHVSKKMAEASGK